VAAVPNVDEVRAWLKLADSSMSDEELADVLAGEVEDQGDVCRIPLEYPGDPNAYPHKLRMAIFRRCGRHVAARGIPLGTISSDEFGPSRLASFDAEIERLERSRRKFVFG
jgi:hypothetical protein